MRINTHLAIALLALGAASTATLSAAEPASARPLIGEVRMLAVAPDRREALAALHHNGWLEARGQLLPVRDYSELYKVIGRAWTSSGVTEDQFAIPDVIDHAWNAASPNPYGVMGPGDLITSGNVTNTWRHAFPLSAWIFVGRDTDPAGGTTAASKQR